MNQARGSLNEQLFMPSSMVGDVDDGEHTARGIQQEHPEPSPTQIDNDAKSQSTQSRRCRQIEITVKGVGIVAFVLSCVSLWSSVTSASDTKTAAVLAEWTSRKDFLEFCESVCELLLLSKCCDRR